MDYQKLKNPFATEFGSPIRHGDTLRVQNMTTKPLSIVEEEILDPFTESVGNSHSQVSLVPEKSLEMNEGTESMSSSSGRVAYTQLETSPIVVTFSNNDAKGEDKNAQKNNTEFPVKESIYETLLAFLSVIFNLSFAIGIAYSHYSEGKSFETQCTLVILFISALTVHLVYAFNRSIDKVQIWKTSKLFTLLTWIPGTLTFFMSFADLIFAIKEARYRLYVRPWKNTHVLYLVESLILVFPQTVLQMVFLMQDPQSIPTVKGIVVLFCLSLEIMCMALARIRHDSARRPGRFGSGVDKVIRSAIVCGSKGLWGITYAMLLVTVQLRHPENTSYMIGAILAILVVYEVPLMLSSMNSLRSCIGRVSGMFFLIPQFVSLFVLVLWVNADDTVYITNIGVTTMGAFSTFESMVIIGWLLDGCSDREMDIIPLYPHFFGDLYSASACCKNNTLKSEFDTNV